MSADAHHEVEPKATQVGTFPVLTVGELRGWLEGVPDETHVVVATEGWYDNVGEVVVPGPDPQTREFSAVTLFPSGELDPRQF